MRYCDRRIIPKTILPYLAFSANEFCLEVKTQPTNPGQDYRSKKMSTTQRKKIEFSAEIKVDNITVLFVVYPKGREV